MYIYIRPRPFPSPPLWFPRQHVCWSAGNAGTVGGRWWVTSHSRDDLGRSDGRACPPFWRGRFCCTSFVLLPIFARVCSGLTRTKCACASMHIPTHSGVIWMDFTGKLCSRLTGTSMTPAPKLRSSTLFLLPGCFWRWDVSCFISHSPSWRSKGCSLPMLCHLTLDSLISLQTTSFVCVASRWLLYKEYACLCAMWSTRGGWAMPTHHHPPVRLSLSTAPPIKRDSIIKVIKTHEMTRTRLNGPRWNEAFCCAHGRQV